MVVHMVGMKVCSVFSLESPHRGDSNEHTYHNIFNIKIALNHLKPVAMGFFKGLKK